MPLNAILAALLNEFAQTQQITALPESERFEHFVNYSVLSDLYGGEFNPIDVSTGNQEFGLDGLAIIVNNNLVEDADEVNDLYSKNRYLEVEFVFTQAKTASGFDGGDMLKTFIAVKDFFRGLQLLQGEKVKARFALKEHIYDNAMHFRRGAPKLHIRYVTAGTWRADQNLNALVEQNVDELRATGLFSDVSFKPVDAPQIQQLYFRTKNAVRQQITFSKNVPLPPITDVKESYIGLLPALEYLKLIKGDNGTIKKQLFFDNMRDFIADSDTNREIEATLTSDRNTEFPLRNNGITIVARKLERVSEVFQVEDYQIVNGCQTSHVLYNSREQLTADVVVPVKIIVTENDDVINKIIRGSNFSNEFDRSQLWATEPFHKDLEIFFHNRFEGDNKLFYERRKGQFGSDGHIEKVRIVTPQALLKHFASMFLERPHDVTKYYSALEPEVGRTIFAAGQSPFVYYAAALASYRLESLFRNRRLPAEYKPVRHHLLLGFKLANIKEPVNDFRSRDMEMRLAPMLEVLADPNRSGEVFTALLGIANRAKESSKMETFRQLAKSVALRDAMRREAPSFALEPSE